MKTNSIAESVLEDVMTKNNLKNLRRKRSMDKSHMMIPDHNKTGLTMSMSSLEV